MPCWYFSRKELENTPSFCDGVDAVMEKKYRREGAKLIIDTGSSLKLRYDVCATGAVYFHRFYMFHSFTDFHRYVVASSCLFLAAKMDESTVTCDEVIKAVQSILTPAQFTVFGENPKDEILIVEKALVEGIRFDLVVDLPYSHLLKFIKLLQGESETIEQLLKMSWTFINDSLCTTLCVEWEPDLIAISLLYLSCRLTKFKVSSWVDKPDDYIGKWYSFFVNDVSLDIIDYVCRQILDLYAGHPEPPVGKQPSQSLPHRSRSPPHRTASSKWRSRSPSYEAANLPRQTKSSRQQSRSPPRKARSPARRTTSSKQRSQTPPRKTGISQHRTSASMSISSPPPSLRSAHQEQKQSRSVSYQQSSRSPSPDASQEHMVYRTPLSLKTASRSEHVYKSPLGTGEMLTREEFERIQHAFRKESGLLQPDNSQLNVPPRLPPSTPVQHPPPQLVYQTPAVPAQHQFAPRATVVVHHEPLLMPGPPQGPPLVPGPPLGPPLVPMPQQPPLFTPAPGLEPPRPLPAPPREVTPQFGVPTHVPHAQPLAPPGVFFHGPPPGRPPVILPPGNPPPLATNLVILQPPQH